DWTWTYARVAVGSPNNRTTPGRAATPAATAGRAAAAAPAASSYDEWGNSDSPLSSGDDLEWYSDVVVSSTPAAATGAGSGAAKVTTPPSSASAIGGGVNTPAAAAAAAVGPATRSSKGDDFDLFSAVAGAVVPSATTSAAADAGGGGGGGTGAAAMTPTPTPPSVPPRPAPPTIIPRGDDFALFASVASAAPVAATPRPAQSPPRRRASTSFAGATSVWEDSSRTPEVTSADPPATAAASEDPVAIAEKNAATATGPVAPVVPCTAVEAVEPQAAVPSQTRPVGNKSDTASRSDATPSALVTADSLEQLTSSVASDPAAAAAALATPTPTTIPTTTATPIPTTATSPIPTATATIANDTTTSNDFVGEVSAEALSSNADVDDIRGSNLEAAGARAVRAVEAKPHGIPLITPAAEEPLAEPQVDVAAVATLADATGSPPAANVLQAPAPPDADHLQRIAEGSLERWSNQEAEAPESAGGAVAVVATPVEADPLPATATAAPLDTPRSAPTDALLASAATKGTEYVEAPPPLAFWKQPGMSYNPDFLAAALAAASVATSRLPALGPGDGVSDSDSTGPLGFETGQVPATTSSNTAQEAQEPQQQQEQQQQQQQQQQPGDDGTGDKEQEEDLQPAAAPVAGLSFSDALEASEGWRRSYSPIKSAGIYFNDQGLGGGAGSIFAPKNPPSPPKNGAGSIFGSQPPPQQQPPPPGKRR
ncbi:hypothetical protein Vretimale_2274, partial [Volvox reticuliferus]